MDPLQYACFHLCCPPQHVHDFFFLSKKHHAAYSNWALQGLLLISKLMKETIPLKTFATFRTHACFPLTQVACVEN